MQQVLDATLSTCPSLQVVRIDGNRLQVLADIESIEALTTLSCCFNSLSDVRQLGKLSQLKVGVACTFVSPVNPLRSDCND